MEHIDEAQIHELIDRGAVDDRLKEMAAHVATCEQCTALLKVAESQRAEAAAILRATAPVHLTAPAFDSLLPRPNFDTFDATHASDISMPNQLGNFKQSSIGLRGQAVVFAWVAIVVLVIAGGAAMAVMYHDSERARAGTTQDAALAAAARRAADAFGAPESNWSGVSEDSAAALLYGHIVSVRAAVTTAYSVGEFGGVTYVRVRHVMPSHETVAVIQSATPMVVDSAAVDSIPAQSSPETMPPLSLRVSGPWRSMSMYNRFGFFDAFSTEGRSVMVMGANENVVRAAELYVRVVKKR